MELFINQEHLFEFLTRQATSNIQPSAKESSLEDFVAPNGNNNSSSPNILVAKYSGDFVLEDYWWRYNLGGFVNYIRSIASQYEGFVFHIDTHGGHAAAAMELDGLFQDLKKYGKVIVHSNYLQSAGIMGTTNADRIVGNGEFSDFGSVGVYYELSKWIADLYKKYVVFAYSKKSPDKNKAFREFLKTGKVDLYEDMATKQDEKFMELVTKNRPISGEYKDSLDGGTFMGLDAKLRGFCDHLGTLDFAIDLAKKQ